MVKHTKRNRKSAAARGYNADWRRLRARYLAANPTCEGPGCARPASLVDHRRPIMGPNDPGRLAWSNLQSLCQSCHSGPKQRADNIAKGRRKGRKGPQFDLNGFPIR